MTLYTLMTHDTKIWAFSFFAHSVSEMTLRDLGCFRLLRSVPLCPYCPLFFPFLFTFPFHKHAIPSEFHVFWPYHISLQMFGFIWRRDSTRLSLFPVFYPYVFPIL
jgi:hypothetical protein